MDEKDISFWDAILSHNLTVKESSRIPVFEFKMILKSLNLKLNLKETL